MAGLSGEQVIVDVVAASEQLVPSRAPELPTEPREELEREAVAPTDVGSSACSLGHQNAPGARFCATCGLAMGERAPGPAAASQGRPRPASELSAEELAERDRQHKAALAAAAQFEQQQPDWQPSEGEAVLIHFIADGLTAMGQVWYRGQELQIGPDHPRWPEVRGWITLSRFEQVERWGEQKFDFGPWPGRRYADAIGSYEQLTVDDGKGGKVRYAGPTEAQLLAAEEAERRRGRAAPAPAFG
jgi:hypothetical protein